MSANRSATPGKSLWIVAPAIDLLVGCGGWSAPVLTIAYLAGAPSAGSWAPVFYALALICNYPHYMATIHRAYARIEDRTAYRWFTHYATAAIVALALVAHLWTALVPWLFTAYVMWSPWHYAGQNFGLSMMFLRRAGITLAERERLALRVAFIASYVALLAAFNQGASGDPMVLSLGLPPSIGWPIEAAGAAVFVVGLLMAFGAVLQRATLMSLVPALTLATTQALWFVVPVLMARLSADSTSQLSYSTGVLALMHSAQYLWITQHYAKRDALQRGGVWSRRGYWALLVAGGTTLFVPVPWLASRLGGLDFSISVLVVAAAVNLHHFMLDGVVWKLRDPRVSRTLTDAGQSVRADGDRQSTTGLTRPIRWRRGVAAAVVGLAVLALVDQLRYAMISRSADTTTLRMAKALNPNDSRVNLKLAALAQRNGDPELAEAALRDAVRANPRALPAHHALVKWLVEAGRWEAAAQANAELLAQSPADVDALINGGVLAQRLGDTQTAAMSWQRALDLEDSNADVHLYLAELLDTAGRTTDAVPHYQRYLELVAASQAAKPDARRVALVVTKFGDALARAGQPEVALSQYQLAVRIARASGLPDVEQLAREHGRITQ